MLTEAIRELHDLDDRWIPEQETRDRPVAFDDDDDGDAVLARELDLDADAERRDARIRDEDDRAGDVAPVDLVHRARIEIRGCDRIRDAVREIGTQARALGDLGEDFVEQLGARGVFERRQRARYVRLA